MDQSILYVDVENLQEIAKQALISAIKSWPVGFPKPYIIRLYVRADQTELWRIWVSHNIASVEVLCKGVQHYTSAGSKNSADISLALDALADVLKGRTKHVAVISDDSDYASLFLAIKDEVSSTESPETEFKWFMTDRADTRSQMLSDFFPSEYVQIVACSSANYASNKESGLPLSEEGFSEEEQIARVIIQDLPVGPFKSADCKKIIKQHFPQNHLNKADSAAFGTQLSKTVWPFLEKYGVTTQKTSKKPRKYEITEEAKNRVG